MNNIGIGSTFEWLFLGPVSSPIAATPIKSSIFVKAGLKQETAYQFACRTVNSVGYSEYKNITVTTRNAQQVFDELELDKPTNTNGEYTLAQSPNWVKSADTWQPALLTNSVSVTFKNQEALLARKSFNVTLDDTTGNIALSVVVSENDLKTDEITLELLGDNSPSLLVRANYKDSTLMQSFSSTGLGVDLTELTDSLALVNDDLEGLALGVFNSIEAAENEFEFSIVKTLELEETTEQSQANITDLALTVANENEALTLKTNTLESKVDNNQSSLVQNYFTKTDTNSAISSSSQSLKAIVDNNQAYLNQNFYTKSTADSAIAASTFSLKTIVDNNQASLEQNYYTKSTTTSAIASSTQSLKTIVDNNQASLALNYFTKTTANAAIAASTQTLKADVDGRFSAVYTQVNQVKSDNLGNTQAISSVQQQANNTDAGVSALTGRMSKVETKADGSATALTDLTAKVTSNESGVAKASLTLQSHADSLGNLSARAFFGVDVNNRVTGISINGSSTTSSIDISAGVMRWLDSSGNAAVYYDLNIGSYTFKGRGYFNKGLEASLGSTQLNVGIPSVFSDGNFSDGVFIAANSKSYITVRPNYQVYRINSSTYASFHAWSAKPQFNIYNADFIADQGKTQLGTLHIKETALSGNTYGNALYVSGSAFITGGVAPFTGKHSVCLPMTECLNSKIGDLVVETKLISRSDINNALFEGEFSQTYQQRNVLGALAAWREISITSDIKDTDVTQVWAQNNLLNYYMAYANGIGEGLLNVCGLGGDIEAGELLCASSIKGKAQLQDNDIVHGYTVARSRESVEFDYETQVKQIAVIYLCS